MILCGNYGQVVCIADKAYVEKSGSSIMGSGKLNVYNPGWGKDYDDVFARIMLSWK